MSGAHCVKAFAARIAREVLVQASTVRSVLIKPARYLCRHCPKDLKSISFHIFEIDLLIFLIFNGQIFAYAEDDIYREKIT